ncbi:MAG TPA: DUF4382 domain-containing protein [Steroidobacteraceae bacterium]|jgi:hypothetical protein
MPNIATRWRGLPALAVLLGGAALAGCQSRTSVSATGNTAAQFTHVFLTINQIWFNTSSTAAATDASWIKFPLSTPYTVDLATLNNGTLSQFASDLKLSAGTYGQVMIILADSTDPLTSSASSAGAATNDEVDYLDTSEVAHTVPLAIFNAAQGISISTGLTVAAASSSIGGNSTSSSGVIGTSTAATSSAATTSTSSSPVVTTTSAIVDFDATRDLVPISLSGQPAFALNPHPQSYDVKYSGTIAGAVSLSNVSTLTIAGVPDVQVSAEALSSDGTRHVIVETTRVGSDGTFDLYPLSTASGAPTSYDLVIHGPTIQTVIVKSVPVTNSAPGSAAAVLGTLTLTTATPYLVNFNTSTPAVPSSSVVGFYQTLPLSSEVPYLVEMRAVDPISGVFATDQELSSGALQYGTYVAGGTISLTTANPSQGAATYSIGAINPSYGTATLGSTVSAPASTTITQLFTMTAPPVPTGTAANSIQGTVSLQSSAYDNAELFLTYNGALVASAALTGYLNGSQGTLSLNAVAPGGSSSTTYAPGVYNAEVWAWNSANPTGTLVRVPYANTINMSAGNATGVTLSIP